MRWLPLPYGSRCPEVQKSLLDQVTVVHDYLLGFVFGTAWWRRESNPLCHEDSRFTAGWGSHSPISTMEYETKESRPDRCPDGRLLDMTNGYVMPGEPRLPTYPLQSRYFRPLKGHAAMTATPDALRCDPRFMSAPFVYLHYDLAGVRDCPTNYWHRI